jgi:hypothetical protein
VCDEGYSFAAGTSTLPCVPIQCDTNELISLGAGVEVQVCNVCA